MHMKRTNPLGWLAWVACLASISTFAAEEIATVKDGRINVRGQPSLVGEVITQLQTGDRVVVLEEITVAKPKTNEPPRWARIQMPPNTPVWVFAPFLDPAAKTVKVSRLNLRAGPGENYSVVGRLERGAPVTEIRRVEDWLEIETPPGAYGFVAADLLIKGGAAAALAQTPIQTPPPQVPPVVAPPSTDLANAPRSNPATTATSLTPPVVVESPVPTVQTPPTPVFTPAATPTFTPAVTPAEQPPTAAALEKAPAVTPGLPPAVTDSPAPEAVKPVAQEPPLRRVVRREGLVRSTVSIQAPTYYELLNPDNRKTINYLHTEKLGLPLKDYRGRRIIVTGEEAIDPRWPKTPVIEVDNLELIP